MNPDIYSGSNDIAHFFLKQACLLLRRGGLSCFIVTRYWMEAQLTNGLRRFLTTHATPTLIVDFGNIQVWPDVSVLAIIAQFTRGGGEEPCVVFVAPDGPRLTAEEVIADIDERSPYYHSVPSGTFSDGPWRLRALDTNNLWGRVQEVSQRLDSLTVNTQGIKTGNNEAFTVSTEQIAALALEQDWLLPVAQAEAVRRYELRETGEWVIYTDGTRPVSQAPNIERCLEKFRAELANRAECNKGLYPWWRLQRARSATIVRSPQRLLVPLYATENRFFAANQPVTGMTDVYIIAPTDQRYSVYFLSSVLNSSLLNAYHWTFCKVKRAGYLEYSGEAVSNLPIRRITFTTPEADRQRNVEMGKRSYEAYVTKGDVGSVLAFVADRLAHRPEQSDVVHDLLAFLAEEMIRLNKEKRAEQKRYLDGLVAALRVLPDRDGNTGLDALSGKSKLSGYPGDYQKGETHLTIEELLDVLRKNRSRLGVSLSDSGLLERLRREYEATLAPVLSLKERLARTDRLIDQIVYRLYGLSEDEIAIVEGR